LPLSNGFTSGYQNSRGRKTPVFFDPATADATQIEMSNNPHESSARPVFRVLPPLVALIGVAAFISFQAFHGPMVHDSTKLFALERVLAEHPDSPILHTPAFGNQFPGRIVSMASFVANVSMDGEVSPRSLKITNFVIHVIIGLLLFLLARKLALANGYEKQASWLAIGVAALWVLAPINLASSWYAVQRMAQLSAMFVAVGLLAYIALRQDTSLKRRLWVWFPGVLAALVLATASKENGLLLIPMLFLVEAIFFRFAGWSSASNIIRYLVILFFFGFAFLALLVAAGSVDYSHLPYTMTERLLTQPRVIFLYLQQIILPFGNDPGVIFPVRISTNILSPWTTLPAITGILGLVALAVTLWRRGYLLASFGILFFFVGHLMESTVIPLEPAYLHRNYLPSFGIYMLLTTGGFELTRRGFGKLVLFVFSLLLILFVITAWTKAAAWQSEASYHTATYRHHPDSIRASINFGAVLAGTGKQNEAVQILDAGLEEHFKQAATPLIARIFFACSSSESITPEVYAAIEQSEHWGSENELSQALYNLSSALDAGCPGLDPGQLADSLQALAAQQRKYRGRSWHVDYFVALLRDKAGQPGLSNAYLLNLLQQGEPRAGMFLAERLLEQGSHSEALDTLRKVQVHATRDELDPLRDQFNRLKRAAATNPEAGQ